VNLHPTGNFTLAQKFLLPMLLSWVIFQVCLVTWSYLDLDKNMRQAAEERADVFLNTLNYVADTAISINELQRIVSDLAAERDVELLAVAAGEPLSIVLSTKHALLNEPLSQIQDREMADVILKTHNKTHKGSHKRWHWYKSGDVLMMAIPLALNQGANIRMTDGENYNAVGIVKLNTVNLQHTIMLKNMQIAGVFIMASVMGALMVWGLLYWYVLRPSHAIALAISLRNNGDTTARATVYSTDELGWLTLTTNAMFDEIDQDDIRRAAIETELRAAVFAEQEAKKSEQEACELAQLASHSKSEFLAVMSHEIRTPLNGVLGMAQVLARSELNEKQQKHVQTITRSGNSLLEILNDILDFSKIEANRLELEVRPVDVRQEIADVVQLMRPTATEKNVAVEFHTDNMVPGFLMADSTRLRQIVINLLSNAIKFTAAGTVSLTLKGREEGGAVYVHIGVQDSGIGIPVEKIAQLFQAFTRVDSSTTRKYGGSGLGLVICKRLAEMMGGDIFVESRLGEGSHFWVDVMLHKVQAGA
jgi:signal transduction histidine kinase